ncbi:hypothetical protein CORC01_03820 [Colletotrichum orchidophilum]|uniref:NmrA-like domain-containing protein n=1 Tax=Colletotrichum orchidophilum TaxID=1209926 RepID=A0A1G4BHU1_9PEZI|nr:uncharacterized protein CORC01_03820 [Colletotrichum orchidophilum]OHF00992.1 hypothetical protein CORC01_03820 [Colletotrichum orchidophilum]
MSNPIRNVAIIGATGQMGSQIAKTLLQHGFDVTAIQRTESTKTVPSGAKSIKLDLNDVSALTKAFQGQDAVISAAPDPIVLENQKPWIDAAVAAGVKRIVPSEYSTNVDSPLAEGLPIVVDKVRARRYLVEQIAKNDNRSSWMSVNNGPFFDAVLSFGGLGPNFRSKTARYHNGGDNLIGTTKISDIAETIAKILRDEGGLYKEAENKSVYIHSASVSEKQLTEMAEKATGQKFAVQNLDVEEVYQNAKVKFAEGDRSVWIDFYYQMMYGKGYGGSESFEKMSWNEKVGLKKMSNKEIEDGIKQAAQQAGMMSQ